MPTPKVPFTDLLAELHAPAHWVRLEAIKKIMRRRNERGQAFSDLARLLNDPENQVSKAALLALGKLGDARILPLLAKLLKDSKYARRVQAVRVLEKFGGAQAFAILLTALRDKAARVRSAALSALIQLDAQKAGPHVLEALADPSEKNRSMALMRLGLYNQPHSVSPLMRQQALPHLLAALNDAPLSVRLNALKVLVQLLGQQAVPYLEAAQKDAVGEVRWRALIDLISLAEQSEIIPHLLNALDDDFGPMRGLAVERLSELGRFNAMVVPKLLALANHPNYLGREEVFEVLWLLHDPRSTTCLLNALHGEHSRVRTYAIAALGEIGDRQAIDPLRALLDDEDREVRRSVVNALSQFKEPHAIEPLLKMLEEVDEDGRLATVNMLRQFTDPRVIKPLLKALSDPAWSVRTGAFWALGEITGNTRAFQNLWQNFSAGERDLMGTKARDAITPLIAGYPGQDEQ